MHIIVIVQRSLWQDEELITNSDLLFLDLFVFQLDVVVLIIVRILSGHSYIFSGFVFLFSSRNTIDQ